MLANVFASLPKLGWFIAAIYLVCGAFRLARFNCLAAMSGTGGGKEFLGFPIPAAAGLVASLTLFLLWLDERGFAQSKWLYSLPVIMLFLSFMMVSEVKYPTFKTLDFKAQRTFTKMLIFTLLVGGLIILWEKLLPIVLPWLFVSYLVYGFIRPRISGKIRREIEEEEEDGESA